MLAGCFLAACCTCCSCLLLLLDVAACCLLLAVLAASCCGACCTYSTGWVLAAPGTRLLLVTRCAMWFACLVLLATACLPLPVLAAACACCLWGGSDADVDPPHPPIQFVEVVRTTFGPNLALKAPGFFLRHMWHMMEYKDLRHPLCVCSKCSEFCGEIREKFFTPDLPPPSPPPPPFRISLLRLDPQ